MDNGWEKLLNKNIEEFLLSLRGNFSSFKFNPVLEGVTKAGEELSLGFSCYVLKCYYMLGLWEKLDSETQRDWISYLNSFQKNFKEVPNNSFVDLPMYNFYNSPKRKYAFKNLIKITLNNLKILKRRTSNHLFIDSIRAESKQTIATLYQLGFRNNKKYFIGWYVDKLRQWIFKSFSFHCGTSSHLQRFLYILTTCTNLGP